MAEVQEYMTPSWSSGAWGPVYDEATAYQRNYWVAAEAAEMARYEEVMKAYTTNYQTWPGKWDGEVFRAQETPTDAQKTMEGIRAAMVKAGIRTYGESRGTEDEVHLPVELEWLKDHLDIQKWDLRTDLTIVGRIWVVGQPAMDSDKAAVVYLTSKFMRILDLLREKKVQLIQLPSITIGQVSGGYQARVEIIVRVPGTY